MDLNEAWKNVLGELEVGLSRANFTTWFKDTFIDDYKNREEVVIGVPTNFTKNWLEKKYKDDLLKALQKNLPQVEEVTFIIKESSQSDKKKKGSKSNPDQESEIIKSDIPKPRKVNRKNTKNGLNKEYVFKNFVVGSSNKLAHAASRAVAKSPGKVYNPLFIYGGVGLGKTHLLHAIGNRILNQFSDKEVSYVTCEKFTNHFIDSIKSGKGKSFKDAYRKLDIILMDDVQFIAGKEQTQEEFFHTFNALYQDDKQIVISSDRPPKDIKLLEDRLRSRFESGMIADVGRPDAETRRAILQTKLEEREKDLPDKIVNYIADNVHHSIRELEGALNRLVAYAELNDEKVNLEMAESVLGSLLQETEKRINPEKVIGTVCDFYEIEKKELKGKRRFKEVVLPRQLAMYLLRHELNLSYPQIAEMVNRKDHTTIIHGCDKIEKKLQKEDRLKKELEMIKEQIYLNQ